jgi:hypothetical protein
MRQRAAAWLACLAPALVLASPLPHAHARLGNEAAAAMEIVVRPGDTLIALSRRLLAEPRRWPSLARHNGLANPHLLHPGTRLQVPLALLASKAMPATVLAASGTVGRTDGGPAPAAGTDLPEGTTLQTGADGNVVVRLVDGSVLRLRAGSEVQLREARRYPAARLGRASVQLQDGRVEVQSPPVGGGRPGFRVTTPQGVLAVRGTQFRVAVDGGERRTLAEVLEGRVAVQGRSGAAPDRAQVVDAGFGARIDGDGRVEAPARLLLAPDLAAAATRYERPVAVFAFAAVAGAVHYRAQVARDATFDAVLAEVAGAAPPLRIADLPDGDYVLRVRAANAAGLEGADAELRFTLKARPEPPLPRQPAAGARLIGTVDFGWAVNPEARSYRWQLASDPGFATVALERRGLVAPSLQLADLAPGIYYWRVASERSDADVGPWGDALSFELRATPPPAPPLRSEVDDDAVTLSWLAQPGQRFDLQIARDAAFGQQLGEHRLEQPGFVFASPPPGRWYLRLRVHEADGYVGPWGDAQYVDVPNCLRGPEGMCWRTTSGEPVLLAP